MNEDAHIILGQEGRLGRITLNRPKAINALSLDMIRTIRGALDGWLDDGDVQTILIDGAGARGLCAGGDIRSLWESAREDGAAADQFFVEEYTVNAIIGSYPKPIVSFMDGITMGGGIGVGAHARYRVVTERSQLAMPETIIGFTPDVGGSYLLSRAPGALGLRMALTGNRAGAADAILCGLADRFVASDRLAELAALLTTMDPEPAISAVTSTAPDGVMAAQRGWIDVAYAAATIEAIIASLQARPEPEAAADLTDLAARSPTALKVTLRAIRNAADLPDLQACLDQELRLARALTRMPDFAEGVRAQVIDKDRNPRWSPATLAEVSEDRVAACFVR